MAIWLPHRPEEHATKLPPLIAPTGPGYMPLFCAAQWIATRGGIIAIDHFDGAVWERPFEELLARIASEEVAITGIRGSVRQKIDGHIFAGLRVDYPLSDCPSDLLVSAELYLRSYPYIDDEHWQKGFNDSLETRQGCEWSKLMVLKSDVARHWPFSLADVPPRSGAPGRPTSMHLVEVEHSARWDRGEAKSSVGDEAQALAVWLKNKHPDVPQLKPKTIANRLRHEHRKRRGDARK